MKLLANNTFCSIKATVKNTLTTSAIFRLFWSIVCVKHVFVFVSFYVGVGLEFTGVRKMKINGAEP